MKKIIYITSFFGMFNLHAQSPLITIGASENVLLYNQNEFEGTGAKINSRSAYINVLCLNKGAFRFRLGASYKNTSLYVPDLLKHLTYYWHVYSGGQTFDDTIYATLQDPADLSCKSHQIALNLEGEYVFKSKGKLKSSVGISSEIYLFEFFKSEYISNDRFNAGNTGNEVLLLPLVQDTPRNFFFSAANLNLFYKYTWLQSSGFSLAAKVNLGTNLYSDWDQFKKYAWLGLGLEVGFTSGAAKGGGRNKVNETK